MAMAAAPGSPTTVPPRGPPSIRTGTDTGVRLAADWDEETLR
jgi:hypothetical protein